MRGHVFLCMLAYYVEWHLRCELASKRTPEGQPLQSLRTVLEHLGTLTLNRVTLTLDNPREFELPARKTPLQAAAFAFAGVHPARIVSSKLTVRMRVILRK